jgi:hypothetical protein
VLILVAILAIPFLTAIILFAIPFATIYLSLELFKKPPAIPEKKQSINFFDFALKNYKNGIQNKQ